MPQVIEFLPVGAGPDVRAGLLELVRVCREIAEGEPFRDLRARLRGARLWDTGRPKATLRLLGVGGRTIARSPFVQQVAAADSDEAALAAIADRVFDLNPLLAKAVLEQVAGGPIAKDKIYKYLGSVAYKGAVPSRPDLEAWYEIAIAAGVLKQVSVWLSPGPDYERLARRAAMIDVDEFLAEDRPEPEPEIPTAGGDDDATAAPVAAASAADTAAIVAATTPAGAPVPPGLRHLAAAGLPSPRGRDRAVPVSRFTAGFAADLLDETAARIAAWWGEAARPSQGHRPEDFGFDAEAWVENAEELLYRIAVAAALAFRLDADRDGVARAFKALDEAGVLADLYHGTVPAELPATVDARALMLASLAARRVAEVPELAASLDQKPSAAEAFAALDAALGRGLFRIEILWMLRMLARLGVIRYDDLADFTALPYRVVRDTLFRLGFLDTPYAPDAASLAGASRAVRRAAGADSGDAADEVIAGFALAAGCAYDCPHRKTCDFPCRERLE